jgi:hypothetical protein
MLWDIATQRAYEGTAVWHEPQAISSARAGIVRDIRPSKHLMQRSCYNGDNVQVA